MIKILRKSDINWIDNTNSNTNYFQIQGFINSLIKHYLAKEKLHECLKDLPSQFYQPQTRLWKSIDWENINSEQITGIDLEVFLSILVGAMDTEAPIRVYT